MAQGLETKVQASVGSTVSGFLSAIKAGMQACGSGGNMFASLLNEAETSLPEVEAYDPSTASNAKKNAAQTASAETDTENYDARQAPARQDYDAPRKTKTNDTRDTEASASDSQPVEAAPVEETSAEAPTDASAGDTDNQNVVPLRTQTQEASDEDCAADDTDAAEMDELAALLAGLVPLDDKAAKAVIAEKSAGREKTAAETALAGGEEMTQAQKTALARLSEIHQDIANEGSDISEAEDAAQTQNVVDAAVEEIASKILTIKDFQKQVLQPAHANEKLDQTVTEVAAEEATAPTDAALAQSTDATASQSTQKPVDPYAMQKLLNGDQHAASPATTNNVVALAQAANIRASEVRNEASASGEGKTASTQNTIGSGVRSLGSYDFAGQLSAARIAKGGAAGLPQAIEQVSVQLHKAVKEGLDTITIQLKPVELGKIEIKLEFAADKSVSGTVIADNQATLNVLQKDSSALQRALQDAGLQAQSGCLEFSLRDQGNAGQFAQQQNNGASQENGGGTVFHEDSALVDVAASNVETYYIAPGHVNLSV